MLTELSFFAYLRCMNYVKRAALQQLETLLVPNKVLILLGARRVGKTQLIRTYLEQHPEIKALQLNGDDVLDARLLEERSVANYQRLLNGMELLVIDEAQNIPEIGLTLKLIVDQIPGIRVLATGSSMFDLSNRLGEPLVGRKNTLFLYPLAQLELNKIENYKETQENLEQRLLYGSYPELEQYADTAEKQRYLNAIINDYLLKDILTFDGIRNSSKIYDLLRLVALQLGKEVSLQELGNQLLLSKNTVERYLDLLSKVFVLFKVEGFSKNLRKEITKTSRWYFYDNGIRNALIANFNPLSMRIDTGELWENYLAAERLKKQAYTEMQVRNYFWRTYDQQELDWLESTGDHLAAFEFKWNADKKSKLPKAFEKAYPKANYQLVNRSNYLDFIS